MKLETKTVLNQQELQLNPQSNNVTRHSSVCGGPLVFVLHPINSQFQICCWTLATVHQNHAHLLVHHLRRLQVHKSLFLYNTMGQNKVVYFLQYTIMPSFEFSLALINSTLKKTVFCLVISMNLWGIYFGSTFSKCFKAAKLFTNILATCFCKFLLYIRISSLDSNQFEASR